jgi:uncharacterized protein YndB with AHSA1/START domain
MHDAYSVSDVTVRHRVYVDLPVARVFELLTTADGWNAWFTSGATMDSRPGGSLTFEWRDFGPDFYTAHDFGRVLKVVQNEEFSFTWHPSEQETVVTFKFEPRGNGCIVTVHEHGYEFKLSDVAVALQVASGWGEAMTLFKFYAEIGKLYGTVPRS